MNKFNNVLKGMAMGIAEVIPGVSGGTIAFITGIYPKLINTIKNLDFELIKFLKNEGISGLAKKIDLAFIFTLLIGMVLGLLTGIFGVTYLYENYPEPLWGFFFGLIIASSIYIGRMIGKFSFNNLSLLVGGIVVAFLITIISPAEG